MVYLNVPIVRSGLLLSETYLHDVVKGDCFA